MPELHPITGNCHDLSPSFPEFARAWYDIETDERTDRRTHTRTERTCAEL